MRARLKWVWWWRSVLPCIVGNVRVSLHCCKYGALVPQRDADQIHPTTFRFCMNWSAEVMLFIYLFIYSLLDYVWHVQCPSDKRPVHTTGPGSSCRIVLPSSGQSEEAQLWVGMTSSPSALSFLSCILLKRIKISISAHRVLIKGFQVDSEEPQPWPAWLIKPAPFFSLSSLPGEPGLRTRSINASVRATIQPAAQ